MLVPVDSPLRSVPGGVEPRTIFFLDGIRYSISIAELAFRRLTQSLDAVGPLNSASKEQLAAFFTEALADAWQFVDSTHRLRTLIEGLPGLKQNTVEVQSFLRQSSQILELRNHVQHFRDGITDFLPHLRPLWGILSWVRMCPQTALPQCVTIAAGTLFSPLSFPTLVFDTVEKKFVGAIVLDTGEACIDIAALRAALGKFVAWYSQWHQQRYPGPGQGADGYIELALSLEGTPADAHGSEQP